VPQARIGCIARDDVAQCGSRDELDGRTARALARHRVDVTRTFSPGSDGAQWISRLSLGPA
jgi:hypothetical protein